VITGEFCIVSASRIDGWAYSTEEGSDHLLIEIFIDGRLRASTMADMALIDRSTSEEVPAARSFSASFQQPFTESQLSAIEIVATAVTGERETLSRRVAVQQFAAARRAVDLEKLPWPFPMPIRHAGPNAQPSLQIAIATERLGLRFFEGDGWLGSRGLRLPIRGFAVRRIGPPNDAVVEIKGVLSDGEATAWIAEGKLCGQTVGQRVLTGFALRAAGSGCEVSYAGRFASGGTTNLCRDGEIAASQQASDPLTAIQVKLARHTAC
jgi:hypothetical protein